jgi:hypothetical protein
MQFAVMAALFLADHVRERFDVIHAQSPFPAGKLAHHLNAFLKIPWVLSFHAGEAAEQPEVPYGDLLNPYLKKNNIVTQRSRCIRFSCSARKEKFF